MDAYDCVRINIIKRIKTINKLEIHCKHGPTDARQEPRMAKNVRSAF